MTQYDVVIIGGGMVGASMACALQAEAPDAHLKIAVIEAFALPEGANELSYQPSYDARATALSYGSRCLYERWGVWQDLRTHIAPISQIHVSDRGRFGSARMQADDYEIDALGYVVENHWLGRVLMSRLSSSEDVDFLCPAKVADIQLTEAGSDIEIEQDGTKRTVKARLVVIADGGRSPLCQRLGISSQVQDYGQSALIANVSIDQPHKSTAYERFVAEGPLALLPLTDADDGSQRRCALVMTGDQAVAQQWADLSDQDFLALLQERFGYRLGTFTAVGERTQYPLALVRAGEQVRAGVAIIGNAAHTLHPIAGQGFNLALRGLFNLAKTVAEGCKAGQSPGDAALLQAYVDRQERDQHHTIGFSDTTLKLFSNNDLLLGLARDFGLVTLDLIPGAKRWLAHRAMGLGTGLPRGKVLS